MLLRLSALAVLVLTACRPTPPVPPGLVDHGIHRIPLAVDADGLSGLALAADGALWTVAEKAQAAFRIELDLATAPPTVRAIQRLPVVGLDRREELESIAALDDGSFLIGTEGRGGGVRAYRFERTGDRLEVRGAPLAAANSDLGVKAGGNLGLEGACAVRGRVVLGVEASGRDRGGRWAPLVFFDGALGATAPIVRPLRLTTGTGKLAALDCWREHGSTRGVAIERHYEVMRVLGLELSGRGPVVPVVVRDLGPALQGSLNLEGIVRLPDGRLLMIVDNHHGTRTGDNQLVWLAEPPSW